MKTYIIRVTTIDNLYVDYMVEAKTILEARDKAKEAFFRDFPDANINIKFSLRNPNKSKIKEIFMFFKNK